MHHHLRRWQVLSVVAAMLIVTLTAPRAAVAASCSGASHSVSLSGGSVTPGTGTTTTSFRFRVTYTDSAGCAPTRIVVVVAGTAYGLTLVSGSALTGATYQRSATLPAGTWAYHFETTSG